MSVDAVPYSHDWPQSCIRVAEQLREVLDGLPAIEIEHVGSTAVPGLAAKPVVDIDVIVRRELVGNAIGLLEAARYVHRGVLDVTDREAFVAPDDDPPRNMYVCVSGTLHVRNHLAARADSVNEIDMQQQMMWRLADRAIPSPVPIPAADGRADRRS